MIKAELHEKIVSVQLLVIAIIDFKCYPSTNYLMQGRWFIDSILQLLKFETFLL